MKTISKNTANVLFWFPVIFIILFVFSAVSIIVFTLYQTLIKDKSIFDNTVIGLMFIFLGIVIFIYTNILLLKDLYNLKKTL